MLSFLFSCTDSFVKVVVKEINFATPDVQVSATPEFEKKESGGIDFLTISYRLIMFVDCKQFIDIFFFSKEFIDIFYTGRA